MQSADESVARKIYCLFNLKVRWCTLYGKDDTHQRILIRVGYRKKQYTSTSLPSSLFYILIMSNVKIKNKRTRLECNLTLGIDWKIQFESFLKPISRPFQRNFFCRRRFITVTKLKKDIDSHIDVLRLPSISYSVLGLGMPSQSVDKIDSTLCGIS